MFILQFTQEEVNSYCPWLFAILLSEASGRVQRKSWTMAGLCEQLKSCVKDVSS